MIGGWRYRLASVLGTASATALAVAIANHSFVRNVVSFLPVLSRLLTEPPTAPELAFEATTAVLVVVLALAPLYKPRPRRILDIAMRTLKRTGLALLALAAIGYFDYTYRLPRVTLLVAGGILLVVLPVWFVVIRRRPRETGDRILIVGDDSETMDAILESVESPVVGYVSPPSAYYGSGGPRELAAQYTDGGSFDRLDALPCLGGLSRLDEVFVRHEIDTAVLAFAHPDREEFFGTLDSCYEHGIAAKVHRDHAHVVLSRGVPDGDLVDIDLEPWDWQDHVVKRAFDIGFALAGLLLALPVVGVIALAIKLVDGGPVFYRQERTAAFGDTFEILKFRTMRVGGERSSPTDEENDRITTVGKFLRPTHLDEIPQLWAILLGQMSVVGPRAVWTDEEEHLERVADSWRKRWFVKPGLTGLAQVNGASSLDPEEKLQYDVEYIRSQSFWFDMKIVVRQVWMVLEDVMEMVRS
ncbi:sugar transferase [Natronomonas sp. EA1]|uniref:sugar transferase n=1 Tax=Natronomonas sp. EA1 TaxID=3421655 RepID=UPI003EBEFA9E